MTLYKPPPIVLDTSVLISGLFSTYGAAHRLLTLIGKDIRIALSVPLVFEYEAVLKRNRIKLGMSDVEIEDLLEYYCSIATCHKIEYLWRPALPDPGDDLVLEVGVTARCAYIVTHNIRHFRDVDLFGITAVTPIQYLRLMELNR